MHMHPRCSSTQKLATSEHIPRAIACGLIPYSRRRHRTSTNLLITSDLLSTRSGASAIKSFSLAAAPIRSQTVDANGIKLYVAVPERSRNVVGRTQIVESNRFRFGPDVFRLAIPRTQITLNHPNHRMAFNRNFRRVACRHGGTSPLAREQNVLTSDKNPNPVWESANASLDLPDPD